MTLHEETQFIDTYGDQFKVEDGCLYFLLSDHWKESDISLLDLLLNEKITSVNGWSVTDVKISCIEDIAESLGLAINHICYDV